MINKIDLSMIYRTMFFFMIAMVIFSASTEALAAAAAAGGTADTGDVLGNSLCALVQSLSGGIAKSIATVAIIGVAGGLLMGKFNWVTAMTVSVGVIIIFSAGKMVNWISGGTGNECA